MSGWAVFLKGNWATDVFITNYIPLVLFWILYVGARIWKRSKWIAPEDMDFKTGLDIVEAACYEEPAPRNWGEKVWAWLVSTVGVCNVSQMLMTWRYRCKPRKIIILLWELEGGVGRLVVSQDLYNHDNHASGFSVPV